MKNTQASLAEFARDVRVGLRDTARSDLEGFEAIMQTKGYEWLGDRVAMLLASASGSRVPIADLMKTPSRTQTVKKTRAIATTAKDISSKVVMANGNFLGSPINKASSSSRAPLSPLGGRNLNVHPANVPILASSPAKSQPSKASTSKSSGKSEKAKTKVTTGKKGRAKKVPDGENVATEAETSMSSRSGNSQSTQSGDLMSNKAGPKGKKGAVSESVRPPRSPQRAVPVEVVEESVDDPMEAQEKLENVIEAAQSVQDVDEQEAVEEVHDEAMAEEEEEAEAIKEDPANSAIPMSSASSAPSRPKNVDLSIIAEAEEDRSSITVPSRSFPTDRSASHSSVAQSQTTLSAHIVPSQNEEASIAVPIQTETVSLPPVSAPPAPPIPARHVRSSWLNKALGSGTTNNTQRTSDGTDRSTLVPAISSRLSTADFPTMRKSLAQPGVLAKRKSEVVADPEEEVEERRPEKVARVETAIPIPTGIPTAPPITAPLPGPSVNLPKPIFERQPSQELFARSGPSLTLNQSTSTAPEPVIRERPSSEIDRVTKALDDMKERQQAKEVAKQKAALTSSVTAASASANRPKTTTGSGFLRGLGNLARSVGIGAVAHNQADPNEEEERRRLEEEEERKAREELNEIMKKVDEPEIEEKQGEDVEMIEKAAEKLAVSEAKVVEEDELDSEEEAEVNQSIDFDSIPMNLGSPPRHTAQPQQTGSALISTTPARLPRNQIHSTTPQGTPPRSLPVLAPSRTVLQTSPRQAQEGRQAPISLSDAMAPKATVHDRINLFNNVTNTTSTAVSVTYTANTPSAAVPRSVFLFSPTRNAAKQSTVADTNVAQATAISKEFARPAEQRQVSPSPDTDNEAGNETEGEQDEAEEEEEEEEEEEQIEKPTMSRPVSQAGSIFGQASVIANKALGVKPAVGQFKSVQLAASAQKKDLAASERRAMIKEQRMKNKEERIAEEKELKAKKESEEKKRKLVEMEKRKQESEARRAAILKQKEEKAAKERAEAEKERAEMEKRKLASSQNRPGALQPAKRVISASSSTLTLSTGVGKMKEPAKLTKPAGPIPSAHGPSKLVPSTFRTAPAPPETPAHQMSQAGTIRLVGQPQAQPQPQATQANQGERKPLGPPTRPSAIRASQQVQAIRQSAAVTSQQTHTHTQTSSVLAQSRLALQSQLEAEAAEIASEDIVLPDIASEYSDSGDETDTSPAFKRPAWAESPELRAALAAQARKNPDELFGPIRPLMMEEIFKQHKGKFRSRTSSGNWTRDGLKKEEEEEYARRMGFTTGTGQW